MSERDPQCPRCRVAMEQGYLLDRGHMNTTKQVYWVAGAPEHSFWGGMKTSKRAVLALRTWRCPRCGLLESYAHPLGPRNA